MSRTDKDVPYRVHVARLGREAHDHRFGECDYAPTDREWVGRWSDRSRRQTCGLEISGRYYYTLTFFPRTKLVQFFAGSYYNAEKERVRARTRDIVKLYRAGEDIEWEDVPSRQHRHSAEWEAW